MDIGDGNKGGEEKRRERKGARRLRRKMDKRGKKEHR